MNNLASKRFLRALILTLLTLLVTLGCSQTTQFLAPAVPLKPPVQAEWPTVETSTIDIADVVYTLRGKPQKELDDQLRDWAVYGRLTQMGVDKDTLAKATYRMAPVRLAYLHDAFMFDYGRGRRAVVGDKDVLLFYDRDDPDRVTTLGHLADRVRMEIGEIPEEFQIFEIAGDVTRAVIHLNRKASIPGSEMFGPQYGYFEQTVSGLEDFKGWLGSIDDVTYARMEDGRLNVGGRRSLARRTPGVTVEDVAVLVNAQRELGERRKEHEQKINRVKAKLDREYQAALADPTQDRDDVTSQYQAIVEQIEQHREFKDSPGFSLDPQWNPKGLPEMLDELAANPCSAVISAIKVVKARKDTPEDATPLRVWEAAELLGNASEIGDPQSVCRALQSAFETHLTDMATAVRSAMLEKDVNLRAMGLDAAMQPLWQIEKTAPPGTGALAHALVVFVRASHQIQCARYDGPLQGTRVGMTLFYADLLAKLWQSVDYHHSAPALAVPGFLSGPRINLEAEWKEEVARSPYTRIWFGPKQASYARSVGGETLWFEHIATRVFAAGFDPASPGIETQPREDSRRSIGWWDRHYRDIAEYEPQYHVQNQIIKWSIITGWNHDAFPFLEDIQPKTDYRFDSWYASNKQALRYRHPIELRPTSDWVTGTECIDVLGSYLFPSVGRTNQISGGVSLAGKRSFEAAPKISVEAPRSLRHAVQETREGAGTATRSLPRYKEDGLAVVELGPETRTRTRGKDLQLKRVSVESERVVVSSGDGANAEVGVRLASDQGEIGTLRGTLPRENVVKLDFERQSAVNKQFAEAADAPKLREEAKKQLAAGDAPAAGKLYELAQKKSQSLPPDDVVRQALADILSGRAAQGLEKLGDPAKLPKTILDDPFLARNERLGGLNAVTRARQTNDASLTIVGVPAKNMGVVADGIELPSSVRLDTPLRVEDVPLGERGKLLADKDTVVYAPKGAFGNRYDVEAAGNGFYAATEKVPNVDFKKVRAQGRSYAPDQIVTPDGTVYEKLPFVAADGSVSMKTHASTAVFIHLHYRCDSNRDGTCSDEERKASGIR